MKNSAQIIDALGGAVKLARKMGWNPVTVQAWKKRGIPPKIQLAYPALIKKGRKLAEKTLSSPEK